MQRAGRIVDPDRVAAGGERIDAAERAGVAVRQGVRSGGAHHESEQRRNGFEFDRHCLLPPSIMIAARVA